jgi:glutathione S-transferase
VIDRLAYTSRTLGKKPFLMGETFTVADGYLFVMLRWCERFEIDMTKWPQLDDYYHRILQRPAVHAALVAEGLIESKRHRRSA